MKKKFKIITIEDIALQFIKHNEPIEKDIISNDTIVDSKFYVKRYNKSSDSLSQTFEKLIPCKENQEENNTNNKVKLIKFYKIPQKILGDDEEYLFDSVSSGDKKLNNSKIIAQNTLNIISNGEIKLREIKPIKYTKKLFFNINYQNAYDCISEIYLPLMKNLETISSLKTMTDNILTNIELFWSHSSIFELNQNNNNNNSTLLEIMEELKIFELVVFILIIFILHIVLEAKIEYVDNYTEDDILIIYQNSYSVLQKIYEIIMLMLLLNEKNNNKKKGTETKSEKLSFESLCSKYVKEFFKKESKPVNNEQIINRINENISASLKLLFNACNILFGNLISFKKDSGNLESPDEEEIPFLLGCNNTTDSKNKNIKNEKIFLSKEFNDQYSCIKTIYLYFTKDNQIDINKTKSSAFKEKETNNKEDTDNNYDLLSPTESSVILTRLTSVFSSFKEISNCFLLYYTNFKILLEKNKVKPPFLPPLNTKKYTYTLVMDLDETLVHYIEEENRAYVQVRPYADYFLSEMGKYFEIVIFTAAAEDYADIVLNELDKNNAINYKLYQKHTEQINGVFIKDLSKLGRDIEKVIIVDNNKDNFSLQPENGLHICSFLGDQNDDELYSLSEDLMKIVDSKKKDIRPIIKEIDAIMKKRYEQKDVVLE